MVTDRNDFYLYFIYVGGLVAGSLIRVLSSRKYGNFKAETNRASAADTFFLSLLFVAMGVVPFAYFLFPLFDPLNYTLPLWAGIPGTLILISSLLLLWRSHKDLSSNWTISVSLRSEHTLITKGVYSKIRHPIYASHWLWAIAQPLLLHNWIAGFAMIVVMFPFYFYRVPREEQMMIERFGDRYREYIKRTGGVWPSTQQSRP
ncbi:protein-S-isoprenylcysteine O-methyltransferase [Chitinispirillales bacterium ANBcel5]|uniref:protein-S-isoprenylcysteine O-methyltransferase n=1 Tax=Cellulosispirillum alkaliphilum TaxID=3039283 RepID=UPI002A52BC31|nr:protein-S-isoprenylcysteine O-methyltransferase [Chitinispirillales bacterium ANBcel5]